jgi:hypothetical protein
MMVQGREIRWLEARLIGSDLRPWTITWTAYIAASKGTVAIPTASPPLRAPPAAGHR